jgi:uncharacterized protein (UPF0371 family)
MIDPFHLAAYGTATVNYNRDVEAYPLLKAIWEKMTGGLCPYKSPTDMGVNRIGFGIVDDDVVREASKQEVIRRYFRYAVDFEQGVSDETSLSRAKALMCKLGLKPEDRIPVLAAREAAQRAREAGKGKSGGEIVSAAAIQLKDGTIVTGRNSDELHAAAAMMLNAIKTLAGIPDKLHLITPEVIHSITHVKTDILKAGGASLTLEEALICLAVSCHTSSAARIAAEKLSELRGCETHLTNIVGAGDLAGLRRLGCRFTCDPYYATTALFTSGE